MGDRRRTPNIDFYTFLKSKLYLFSFITNIILNISYDIHNSFASCLSCFFFKLILLSKIKRANTIEFNESYKIKFIKQFFKYIKDKEIFFYIIL